MDSEKYKLEISRRKSPSEMGLGSIVQEMLKNNNETQLIVERALRDHPDISYPGSHQEFLKLLPPEYSSSIQTVTDRQSLLYQHVDENYPQIRFR